MINYLRNYGTYEPKFESRSEEMLFLKELEFWEISTKHPFGTIAPFLPIELESLGIDIGLFGYIFGVYALAIVTCSPIVGYFLNKHKQRRRVVQVGLLTMSIALFGFALAPMI